VNSGKLQDWLQIIGLFGVIASLVFVGLQMMQDREIALSVIYQERTNSSVEYYMSLATDEVVRSAFLKVKAGKIDELSEEERLAHLFATSAGLRLRDNSHYQWEQGFAPDAHWAQIRAEIERNMRNPYDREVILSRRQLRPTFLMELEDIARSLDVESRSKLDISN
jgi:hypothetical protein